MTELNRHLRRLVETELQLALGGARIDRHLMRVQPTLPVRLIFQLLRQPLFVRLEQLLEHLRIKERGYIRYL